MNSVPTCPPPRDVAVRDGGEGGADPFCMAWATSSAESARQMPPGSRRSGSRRPARDRGRAVDRLRRTGRAREPGELEAAGGTRLVGGCRRACSGRDDPQAGRPLDRDHRHGVHVAELDVELGRRPREVARQSLDVERTVTLSTEVPSRRARAPWSPRRAAMRSMAPRVGLVRGASRRAWSPK